MATHAPVSRTTRRFTLRQVFDQQLPDGAWWPESRRLSGQLEELFALWPAGRGSIIRVLYSPPDWEDRPGSVAVPWRRVKTGSFPRPDTHQLTLPMFDGARRSITVIPPDPHEATAALDGALEDHEGGHV